MKSQYKHIHPFVISLNDIFIVLQSNYSYIKGHAHPLHLFMKQSSTYLFS
jgi:hypothetical protein